VLLAMDTGAYRWSRVTLAQEEKVATTESTDGQNALGGAAPGRP